MKKIQFGASMSKPTDQHKAAYQSFINNGGSSFRIRDIFRKGWSGNIKLTCDIIEMLTLPTNKKRAKVMICLNDLPHEWLSDYTTVEKAAVIKVDLLNNFNRFPMKPHRRIYYPGRVHEIINECKSRNLLQYLTFELGNEPDALRYFWGTPLEAIRDISIKYFSVRDEGCPVYSAGFTSSLMRLGKPEWDEYISEDQFYTAVSFSAHYYRQDSKGTFNFVKNKFPTRNFSDIKITEWGLFTKFNASGTREAVFNSHAYMIAWVNYLTWIYNLNLPVSEIFVHPWAEFHANNTAENMAYWIKNSGNWSTQDATYMLYDLMEIVQNGYAVTPTGIRGFPLAPGMYYKEIIVTGETYSILLKK